MATNARGETLFGPTGGPDMRIPENFLEQARVKEKESDQILSFNGSGSMKVDFNNVRLQAINSYNSLIRILNGAVGGTKVIIQIEDLQRTLDTLRDKLITIGLLYEEGRDDIRCILTDDMKVLEFNPEE